MARLRPEALFVLFLLCLPSRARAFRPLEAFSAPDDAAGAQATPLVAGSSFELSLEGRYFREVATTSGQNVYQGIVSLSAPLSLLLPSLSTVSAISGDLANDATDQSFSKRPELTPVKPAVASAGQRYRARNPSEPQLLRMTTGTFVRRLITRATRVAGLPLNTRRLDALSTRSRASAALPELKLRAAHSTDRSARYAPTLADPTRFTESGAAGLTLEARISWKLDRLLYASDELSIERIRQQRDAAAIKLTEQVLAHLFSWQRAQVELDRLGWDATFEAEANSEALSQRREARIHLDILTDGWFGDALRHAFRPRTERPASPVPRR